jgi:hypothetical protein
MGAQDCILEYDLRAMLRRDGLAAVLSACRPLQSLLMAGTAPLALSQQPVPSSSGSPGLAEEGSRPARGQQEASCSSAWAAAALFGGAARSYGTTAPHGRGVPASRPTPASTGNSREDYAYDDEGQANQVREAASDGRMRHAPCRHACMQLSSSLLSRLSSPSLPPCARALYRG